MAQDKFDQAQDTMVRRFKSGEKEEAALLDAVAKTVIVDRLVPPSDMTFRPFSPTMTLEYKLNSPVKGHTVGIHRHALNQLCSKVGVPMTYTNNLERGEPWKQELLAHNLNELFHKNVWVDKDGGPLKFLHRVVGDELRGFLTRRYNRYLASAPLLRTFVDVCQSHGARPIESSRTPVRVALKYLLPEVFEAFPGEYVCLGSEWVNSDFGAGRLTVSQTVWRVATSTSSVLDETFGRVHLGSIIEDADIDMSEETAKKEVEALRSAIKDAVNVQFSQKTVDRLMGALRAAHDAQIPWSKLKGQLKGILSKLDIEWLQSSLDSGSGIVDLPSVSFSADGERVPNLYWAASAISALASKTDDEDKKLELQKEAGKLLGGVYK